VCGSIADIQSPTAEIRRGKKEERKKKPQGKGLSNSIGQPQQYEIHSANKGILSFKHFILKNVHKSKTNTDL